MLRGFHHFSRIQMLLDFIDNAASCWVCANKTKQKEISISKSATGLGFNPDST